MRKQARIYTFKLIYEYLFLKEKNENGLPDFPTDDFSDADKLYIDTVYNGVIENYDVLYQNISRLSSDFKAERIFKVDLALLLLSMYEIQYFDDVPNVVSINEAVEIAKVFSTEKSHIFINGILANFIKKKKYINDIDTTKQTDVDIDNSIVKQTDINNDDVANNEIEIYKQKQSNNKNEVNDVS